MTEPVRRLAAALALLFGLLALALGVGALWRHRGQPAHAYFGTPLEPPKTAADAVLTDQNGRPAHVLDPAYRATFLFFGYTHCPHECPLALASLAKAYHGLPAGDASRTRIAFVTVDPARDTPAAVKRYVESFGAPISGLTGSQAELAPVWEAYGVFVVSVVTQRPAARPGLVPVLS